MTKPSADTDWGACGAPRVAQRQWPMAMATATVAEQELLLGARHVPPELEVREGDVPLVLVDTYSEPSPVPSGGPEAAERSIRTWSGFGPPTKPS